MPKREQLLQELSGDNAVGILLMVQMDGVPETLQFVVVTTEFDEKAGGLRDRGRYVIRAIGVHEHRFSVGAFQSLEFVDDHPLLHQHNTTPVGLFYRGQTRDANALLVDMLQAYASTFGPWRQMPTYFNVSKPLFNLLTSGGDLLGEMPKPLAESLVKVLEKHGLETKMIEGTSPEEADEHGRSQFMQALVIDDSYVIALDFTVEFLGRV